MKAKRIFGLGALTMISACVSGGADSGDASTPTADVTAPPPLPAIEAGPELDSSLLFPAADASADAADASSAGSCPKNEVLTEAMLDVSPGWKGPLAALGSCTPAELTQLEANFKNNSGSNWSALESGLGNACKQCIFTDATAAKWGPIVLTSGGADGFINFGACFAYVDGEPCGKALQYEQFCYDAACDECTSTVTERQQCIAKAGASGMCFDFAAQTNSSCPNIQTSAKKCNSIIDAAKTLCGGGTDAGDAG